MRKILGILGTVVFTGLLATAGVASAATNTTVGTQASVVQGTLSASVTYSTGTALTFPATAPGQVATASNEATVNISAPGYKSYSASSYDTDLTTGGSSPSTIPGTDMSIGGTALSTNSANPVSIVTSATVTNGAASFGIGAGGQAATIAIPISTTTTGTGSTYTNTVTVVVTAS